MAAESDWPARLAGEWDRIRSVMRSVEDDPDWPRGLGDCQLEVLPDGEARWRFADRLFVLDGDLLVELVTDPTMRARVVNLKVWRRVAAPDRLSRFRGESSLT